MFGQPAPYDDVPFPFVALGQILEPDRLASRYSSARLDLCFSPTSPSSVGYEIAYGLPPATPGPELNFDVRRRVWHARATPEAVAETILEALADAEALGQHSGRGVEVVKSMRKRPRMPRGAPPPPRPAHH